MDNGASGHMTGEEEVFISLEEHSGQVTFADNSQGQILGIGKVGKDQNFSIKNVLFVQGLKHNLLSVCQLCDCGFSVLFLAHICYIVKNWEIIFTARRHNGTYIVYLDELVNQNIKCLSAISDQGAI